LTHADTQTPLDPGLRPGWGTAPGMGVPGAGDGPAGPVAEDRAGAQGPPDGPPLYTGVPRLDAFIGGFRPSQLVLLDSSSRYIFDITSRICVEAVGEAGRGLVFIDGGNSADPHAISAICRARGLDKGDVLRRMSVARAFTAYQMDSLINEGLEDMVRRTGAGAVVVSCLLDLFFDKDMEWQESFRLIRRCVGTLGRLASELGVTVFVTNYGFARMRGRRALFGLMYGASHSIVRFEGVSRGLRVTLPHTGRVTLFCPVPPHQTILDRFFAVCEGGGGMPCGVPDRAGGMARGVPGRAGGMARGVPGRAGGMARGVPGRAGGMAGAADGGGG